MNVIRIRRTIDSDTLHLPELIPFLGHSVEIVIQDQPASAFPVAAVAPGTGDWDTFHRAALALGQTYDFAALAEQDARDMLDAEDRVQ